MAEDFDPYASVIGLNLESISVSRGSLDLRFRDSENTYEIILGSGADICTEEKYLFQPASDYDIIRARDLAKLYSALGTDVLTFAPMHKKRVCKMKFKTCELFVWAGAEALPDCLFLAQEINGTERGNWWLIDDA